jgi:hypothetical protein
MTHQYTDTQGLLEPFNSSNETAGGRDYAEKSRITYRDALNVNDIKSIIVPLKQRLNPSGPNQKLHLSKLWPLTSSLNSPYHKDMIPYSQSQITTVQKQQSSFHAWKKSLEKKQPLYTPNTCSPDTAYPQKSSVITTRDSLQNSPTNSANCWAYNRTSPQHITHERMGNQNDQTSG